MNGISLSKILLAVRGVHSTASLTKKHGFPFFNQDSIFQLCLSILDSVIRFSIFDFRFSLLNPTSRVQNDFTLLFVPKLINDIINKFIESYS